MNILDYIPTGHKNAVSRRWLQTATRLNDRKIRDMISAVNTGGEDNELIINLQDGKGYFRPAPGEDRLVGVWKAMESSRCKSVNANVEAAQQYLNRNKKPCKKSESELEKNQITMDEWLASLNGGG